MRTKSAKYSIIFLSLLFSAFISNYRLRFTNDELHAQENLEQLKQNYLSQHKYSEFIDYLKGARDQEPARVSYYIALSRYEQLGYLEETQNWEEYFDRGEDYRREFIQEARRAVELASQVSPVSIYARCLLWRFHSDMLDEQQEEALRDLLSVVKQYSELPGADLSAIKFVADKLSGNGERLDSQKVYKIYLERLTATLSENKEPNLISLAKELAFSEDGRGNPFFAEEVFKKLQEINPDFVLDGQTQYLRAYNLERIKQYEEAYKQYGILAQQHPRDPHYKEALFKMGVICAYALADISSAQDYFTKLIKSFSQEPQAMYALYHLGLISQYQGDIPEAQRYYNSLKEKAEETSCCDDLVNRANARLKEIEQGRPLEFNLRNFMDALKQGDVGASNVDIAAEHFKLSPQQEVRISSFVLPAESGCMPVHLEYFWSGDLGIATPGSDQASFVTHYSGPGTKLIQLTVIVPSGVLGRDFIFLDVAEE
ncbi:MAG: tetratricopeptide repeat protein [Candidatus Omnitrophota bacterium]